MDSVDPFAESIDHASYIRSWDEDSFNRGRELYHSICITCHGTPSQLGTLPTSRRFWQEPFKNGNDPHSIYQTISRGFGQMPAWPALSPQARYDIIDYIREAFLKTYNPGAYFPVTSEYLDGLPKGTGNKFQKTPEMIEFERGPQYLRMNFGPVLHWTLEAAPDNFAYKGIAVRLDKGAGGISKGRAWMLYDHDTLRVAAAWTGDRFIDWKGIALDGSHQTHAGIVGDKAFVNPPGPGWARPGTSSFEDPRIRGRDGKPYGPLPRTWAHYRGSYRNGRAVILAYSVGDAEVLEMPGFEENGDMIAFSRTFNIGRSSNDLLLRVCPRDCHCILVERSELQLIQKNDSTLLRVPAAATPVKFTLLIGHSDSKSNDESLRTLAAQIPPAVDLRPLLNGGPARWNLEIITQGELGDESGPFAVDAIPYPPNDRNPWQSWMRMSGFDFFQDGKRAAVCTWLGDVWLVGGIDGDLQNVKWKRIAAGLFQPLGLKIVDESIYVCCRDQIVRLHDLNGDDEIDFYENFNNDHQVTEHFHEFAMDLQTDREGNFYYTKGGRHALPAVVPQHGTLLKVSQDGSSTEIIATGFRAPNGVCVNDDGTFFITDQEGHWTPKNRINWVKPGGFYGYMWAYDHPRSSSDEFMEQPLVWITNDTDRSPGEIVRVTSDQWGPFKGALLNLSYGTGRVFLVPHERVNGAMQGGVTQLPMPDFPTGVMRGRFHPRNGQLYACGLFAWAGNQTQDGGFYRVRYTGKPAYIPIELHALKKGMQITFSDELDRASAEDPENYAVRIWSLIRSAQYGSEHKNERSLKVARAKLASDGKTVRLDIPDIRPTWGMRIECELLTPDGKEITRTIDNSIFALP